MNDPHVGISILVSLGPVLLFLLALFLLDSFRLVRPRSLVGAMAMGVVAGFVSYVVNTSLMEVFRLPVMTFAIFVAPVVEETAKEAYLAWLLQTRRAGFLVDAAILGFAAGSGFALTENLFYLKNLGGAPLFVWIIRGFGTAIMHGGASALFAIIARALIQDRALTDPRVWGPGLLAAIGVHMLFNRMLSHPVTATVTILVVVTGLMVVVYRVGEKRLRIWLGQGFDRDTELLALINEGRVRETPLGLYLLSLRNTFRPDTVADMLCLLRLQVELSIRAKGTLVLREQGLQPAPDPELPAKLEELRHLDAAIGKTGRLALRPVCPWTGPDRWQRHLIEE
ncbi:hypothetical protein CSB20_08915 [bacterium DOLZORAL124_64_63]|nr:MAG: hypothetical protein CSB20_08915 [bacterium DOLZORAL124_64_63]